MSNNTSENTPDHGVGIRLPGQRGFRWGQRHRSWSSNEIAGSLAIEGTTASIAVDIAAQASGTGIGVLGNIPITFTDDGIDNPSNPGVSLEDNGVVEFILVFVIRGVVRSPTRARIRSARSRKWVARSHPSSQQSDRPAGAHGCSSFRIIPRPYGRADAL
jgi:hypothetical protein